MAAWTTRLIDAPADDLLSLGEVGKLLRLSEDTLRRMIAAGDFPDGLAVGKQAKLWDWRSVTYYRLRLEMSSRLAPPAPGNKPQPAATEG